METEVLFTVFSKSAFFILGIMCREKQERFLQREDKECVCRKGLAVAAIMCEERISEDIYHCEMNF